MRKFSLAIVAACVGVMWSATAWAVTVTVTGQNENGTAVQDQVVHVDLVTKQEVGQPAPQRHPVQHMVVRIHHTGTGQLTYNDKTIDDRNNYVLLFYYTTGGTTYAGTQP